MADTHETIADIIAEMRGARTEFPFVYLMGEPDTPEVIDLRTKEITEPRKINIRRVTVKELADRFEAALKRERVASSRMREAIEKVSEIANKEWDASRETPAMWEMMEICTAALAAPPRNCDVGTAMEQGERFAAYCRAHKHPESECLPCPLFGQTGGYCELAWAQMPYEEGGAK